MKLMARLSTGIIFVLLAIACTAEQPLIAIVKLSQNAINAKEINQEFGGLQLQYERMPIGFKTGTGEDRFPISNIVYSLKHSSGMKTLGKLDKIGVWNANGVLIKKFSDIRMAGELIGISSSVLTNPLGVSLVITSASGGYKETNAAAIVYIDLSSLTLALFEMEP